MVVDGMAWKWVMDDVGQMKLIRYKKRLTKKNLDSRIIMSTIQFYIITHNSRSNHWIKLRVYLKILKGLFYIDLKCQVNRTSRRPCDKFQKLLCEICISFLINLELFSILFRTFLLFFQYYLGFFLLIINRIVQNVFRFFF